MLRFTLCATICAIAFPYLATAEDRCDCQTSFRPPSGVVGSYLPEELQEPIFSGSFLTNGLTETQIKTLCERFEKYFPNVNVMYLPNKPQVNAVAYGDGESYPRTVELWGGMGKHPLMNLEGLAVILGHEVGHHYGNTDGVTTHPTSDSLSKRYPHGAFCEDQSDFWSTRVGLRIVYNDLTPFTNDHHKNGNYDFEPVDAGDSDEYNAKLQPGINQCFQLLSGGVFAPSSDYLRAIDSPSSFASSGCGHPQAHCRKALYESGMRMSERATCNDALNFLAGADRRESNAEYVFKRTDGVVRHLHYGHSRSGGRPQTSVDFSTGKGEPSTADLIEAIRSLQGEIEALKTKIGN